MKYAIFLYYDVANGEGVKTSLFVSGCTHHCKNCFNSIAWDFNYGEEFTKEVEEKIIASLEPYYIKGLTLLGGEPMEIVNQKGLHDFILKVKETYPSKTIWCFTGYLFEDLLEGGKQRCEYTQDILESIDVLVDGKFIEELKNLSLKFKGSSNQRTIDVKESLKQNKVVLLF